MIEKAYFSNISAAWPLNRQKALVGDHERAYADKVGPTAIRRQQADALKERASLLRPTSRREGERIVFASWAVLAFDAQDLGGVIKAAAARQATLHAVHENETIEPTEAGELVAEVITRFSRRVRSGSKGRTRAEIAAEIEDATKARCALIADAWPKRERPTPELLAAAGVKPGKPMAYATACLYLGKRPKMQREYEIAANREAGRRAGKETQSMTETTEPDDEIELVQTLTHKAMVELTGWWASLTGLYSDEAWEDMWAVFDRMKELGLAADIPEKSQ